jgi:hypothetical protein
MDAEGRFIEEAAFCVPDTECTFSRLPGGYDGTTTLYQLFKSIWTRAKAEVQAARKISIVGVSMHEYLKPAFQFLFAGKSDDIELVFADKSLARFRGGKESDAQLDPLTPVSRLDQLLRGCCPKLRWNVPMMPDGSPASAALVQVDSRRPIRQYASFEEFIQNELGTQAEYRGLILTSVEHSYNPSGVRF